MATAMVIGFAYNAPDGDTILMNCETVIAGAEVQGGSIQIGIVVAVNPTNDTPEDIEARVAAAVRKAAAQVTREDNEPGGVTIAMNDLVMPGFTKG